MLLQKGKYFLGFVVLLLIGCANNTSSVLVQTADSLLWADPDSCLGYLQRLYTPLTELEEKQLELIHQHALLKLQNTVKPDSLVYNLHTYFYQHKDYRHAGEALYIIGAYETLFGDRTEATGLLKQAENCYNECDNVPEILYGMLYYLLGLACEEERLYDVAIDYYQYALLFFKQTECHIYTANTYHHLCSSQEIEHLDIAKNYIDSALYYVAKTKYIANQKEMEITKYYDILHLDTTIVLANMLYLCDSCGRNDYAAEIAQYYLKNNKLEFAKKYIQQLALDTSFTIWSKEQYYKLHADLRWQMGQKEDAYNELKDLHSWQTKEIERTAFSRTYIVSQKYEAAKQQQLRLEEELKKQHAYVWIVICACVILLIGIGTLILHIRAEKNKRQLEQDMEKHRIILRTKLKERIVVAEQLALWASANSVVLPEQIRLLSTPQSATGLQDWDSFSNEFNLCNCNLLLALHEQYPDLTESDLQYIALAYLGFSMTEICFLLNITKRTVWNRKNTIKQHLSLAETENLDDWVKNLQS